MENPFDEMRRALSVARSVQKAADENTNAMADLIRGRLRNVSSYRLASLKRELRDFNIHTGTWKE